MDTPMIALPHDTWSEESGSQAPNPTDGAWHGGVPARPSRHPQDAAARPRESQPPEIQPEPPAILIVDDDQSIAELMAELLGDEGYDVTTATNGAAAVAAARRARPALVITDSMMPGMGGPELIRELRRHPETRSIPVVLMSSVYPRGHQPLDVPFLAKPFGIDEVLELVMHYARIRPRLQLYGEG